MSGSDQARERFADVFAGELLVPGDELRRVSRELAPLSDLANPVTVIHLQRRFGVSFATLRARLLQEKMITKAESDALADTSPRHLAPALGYEVHPADIADSGLHPLAAQPTRVRLLVSTALDKATITMGDAAEVLGTSTEEIRQLLRRAKPDNAEMRVRQDIEEAFFANLNR
jgi:Zn-dependent peptidase ImmA (M78 family)